MIIHRIHKSKFLTTFVKNYAEKNEKSTLKLKPRDEKKDFSFYNY